MQLNEEEDPEDLKTIKTETWILSNPSNNSGSDESDDSRSHNADS